MSSKSYFPMPIILFLIFMVLKLTDQIDWSWWWITAPLWAVFAMIPVIFISAVVVTRWRLNKKLSQGTRT